MALQTSPVPIAFEVARNREVALENVAVLTLHPGEPLERELRASERGSYLEEHTGDTRDAREGIGRLLARLPHDGPGLAAVRATLTLPAPSGHFWHLRIIGERLVAEARAAG